MKRFLLGLKDYENHTSDEGWQLQEGLRLSGWELWGAKFDNNETDCRVIAQQNPDIVLMIDKREWEPSQDGAFDKNAAFTNLAPIVRSDSICRFTVLKDAGTGLFRSRMWAREFQPHGYVVYYHPQAVNRYSVWADPCKMVRTYHSVDAQRVPKMKRDRSPALVSGARNRDVYRLRETCFQNSDRLGLTVRTHPGYSNCGTCTPHFLDALNTWKVHVCCASIFGFALRKIIESVACGCIPITDLPAYDKLPEIDDALVRVKTNIEVKELKEVVKEQVVNWDYDRAHHYAEKAKAWYDYRAVGARLSENLETYAVARMVS